MTGECSIIVRNGCGVLWRWSGGKYDGVGGGGCGGYIIGGGSVRSAKHIHQTLNKIHVAFSNIFSSIHFSQYVSEFIRGL